MEEERDLGFTAQGWSRLNENLEGMRRKESFDLAIRQYL
jgi:hypothetical protein